MTKTKVAAGVVNPVLTIPQGQLKGVKRLTIYDHDYYSFEKIPFAKPPLGELRFRAPQPADSWEGIRDCSQFADKPAQLNKSTGEVEGVEDCLYLNVYAKKLDSSKPLPVMVYIYGGGFYSGEATRNLYSPDYFMTEDVIIVTFNYRLCALGFLSLSDPELQVPGNAGLKDQIMALRWVKENIANFNGDTNNITIFGESAGGVSTHFMGLTEQTKGLFHKLIPMSGCVLNNWANTPPTDFAFRLAKQYGYTGANVDRDVLTHLRGMDPHELLKHSILNPEDMRNGYLFPFGPTVEPYVGEDCVIPKKSLEMLRTAWSNDIPMMLGGTSFEGLLMFPHLKAAPGAVTRLQKNAERVLPLEVRQTHTPTENEEMAQKLIKAHFGNSELDDKNLIKYLDLLSYKSFWHGFHRTVLSRLALNSAPTYLYRFDFDSPDFNHHRTKFCGKDIQCGVAHADDLSYLWYGEKSWKLPLDSAEYKTIQRMVGIWTAFAKDSDPNCEQIKPTIWSPLQKDDPNRALNISHKIEIMELPESTKLDVWDSLYKKEQLF